MLSDRGRHSIPCSSPVQFSLAHKGAHCPPVAPTRHARSLSPRRRSGPIAALLVLAALGAWLLWPRAVPVETILVQRAPAVRTLAVNGTIRPRLSVEVQSPVAGTLTALPLDVGDRVAAGALLARVDDAPQRAAIGEAHASVAAQEVVLAQARRDLARFLALGEFVTRQRKE